MTADSNHVVSQEWRRSVAGTLQPLNVPVLFLAELGGALSRRLGDQAQADAALQDVLDDAFMLVHPIAYPLGRRAGRLASRLRLRGADAVYVALAAELDLPLVTWDQELLARAAGVVDVRTPDQLPV